MGLFKSAEEKRMEERMLVKKAIGGIQRYIEKLEEAKRRYIEEAVQAKQHGIASQYRLARSGLAMAVRQSHVAEQLLLNLELNRQTKDASEITRDFVAGMNTLGKEIAALNGKINVSRAGKRMRTALTKSGEMQENLDGLLEESEMLFGEAAGDTGLESELDRMIERELQADTGATDAIGAELDAMLQTP